MGSLCPTYREAAPTLRARGWAAPIPTWPNGKIPHVPRAWPAEGGWGCFAASEPSDAQIDYMARYAHPRAGVGLVVNGDFVCIDGDIRPKRGESNHDQRLAAARDLTPRLIRLAFDILGPTRFIRRSDNPKFALLYAPLTAADAITLDIDGNPVEIFGDPRSPRQIVIYGLHENAGTPYRWVGGAEPLTHGPASLPRVSAKQLGDYHQAANSLAWNHEFVALAPVKNPKRTDSRRSVPNRPASTTGAIGPYISAALREIGQNQDHDPRHVLAEHLANAREGERYKTMSGCVGALVISGFSDQQIIETLESTYRGLFSPDEVEAHIRALHSSAAGLRNAMSRGFTQRLLPVAELDRELNTAAWSLFGSGRVPP